MEYKVLVRIPQDMPFEGRGDSDKGNLADALTDLFRQIETYFRRRDDLVMAELELGIEIPLPVIDRVPPSLPWPKDWEPRPIIIFERRNHQNGKPYGYRFFTSRLEAFLDIKDGSVVVGEEVCEGSIWLKGSGFILISTMDDSPVSYQLPYYTKEFVNGEWVDHNVNGCIVSYE